MAEPVRNVVVFDIGGVLIDWNPRHLYRKLFPGDEPGMEHFLANVCTHEWNRGQDAGRSFAEGARLLKLEHPDKAELIDAYATRFDEMMPGPIAGTVEISPSCVSAAHRSTRSAIFRPRLFRRPSSASISCAGSATS